MDQQDTLLTLAEVAATFVGFSTIVVVFRSASSEAQRLHLFDVAGLGLFVLLMSILPVLLADFPLIEPFLWRGLSFLVLLSWPIGWYFSARRLRRGGYPVIFGRFPFSPDVAANLAGLTLSAWNVVLPSSSSPARYVAAISCLLALAAMQFVVAAFYPPEEPQP